MPVPSFSDKEKAFFITIAQGASGLSECPNRDGAVVVRDHRIMSYGFTRNITNGKESYTISGITMALTDMGSRFNPENQALFCTRFPDLEEMKLVVATNTEKVYFMGKISDPQVVKFANILSECGLPLELIRLER